MLTRIPKINHRIFRNQSWAPGLKPFLKFNLFYGWNGCGKTTLSNLLRKLEKRETVSPADGDFQIEIDGTVISGTDFSTNVALPTVKVFNRDFVDASVFSETGTLAPIFYFGEHSVEKQKEIQALRAKHTADAAENLRLKNASEVAAGAWDQFCIDQGKLVKVLLSSSGKNSYNNYDKSSFKAACERIKKTDFSKKRLSEKDRLDLMQKKDLKQQDSIAEITGSLPDISELLERTTKLLSTTVVSRVISGLANDALVSGWVQAGIPLHTGAKMSPTCRFCDQPLPPHRIRQLEDHFNREYQQLLDDLDSAKSDCDEAAKSSVKIQAPFKDSLYSHLRESLSIHSQTLATYRTDAEAYIKLLLAALEQKREKPFDSLKADNFVATPIPDANKATHAISEINLLIQQHNETSANLAGEIELARKALEENLISEVLSTYIEKQSASTNAASSYLSSTNALGELASKIGSLEKEISDSLKPADELTKELASYLGQRDLKFEQKELGYVVTRDGFPAQHLSEGEKTAIAFLYFLKSLHDRSFKDAHGIVVIDDPISSLDTNALYCAFGYMRAKTKNAGQLFVFTHNFSFFRQVKNWFLHLNGRKDETKHVARFYMLQASAVNGTRTSQISPLDPLLRDFESEYHYLFYRVVEEAKRQPAANLAEFYAMPNIARRLLESFLAFRYPNEDGLSKQMDRIDVVDDAKKSRILRFLHTNSHDGKVTEPEHDLSILSETPQVLNDVLELVRKVDERHFTEMQDVLKSANDDR